MVDVTAVWRVDRTGYVTVATLVGLKVGLKAGILVGTMVDWKVER